MSSQEIMQFINYRVAAMIERPRMYASSPEILESLLMQLDDIRAFIFAKEMNASCEHVYRYRDFLLSEGFGAATLTSRTSAPCDNQKLFDNVISFWQRYWKTLNSADIKS